MYLPEITTQRIKLLIAQQDGKTMSGLNAYCDIGSGLVSQAGKSQLGMKAKNLYNIAEYLDCSVDYLLGRTDNPSLGTQTVYINGDNNGTQSVDNSVNLNQDIDNTTMEFVRLFQSLKTEDKIDILSQMLKKAESLHE